MQWKTVVMGLLATTLLAGSYGAAQPGAVVAGPAVQVYRNAKASYSIAYPSSWKASKAAGSDIIVRSSGRTAFVTAGAYSGTASAVDIQARQKQVLASMGKPVSKLKYVVESIHSLRFQISEEVVSVNGGQMDVILFDTVRKGRLYDFSGGVALHLTNSDKESSAVMDALNSIKIS
jgi:hypothetical protein